MNDTITFEEVGLILALAAARDQRTVGDADGLAWHSDLNAAGVTFNDASAALTRFYSVEMAGLEPDERRRVTTPDVISIARKIRNERLANFIYEPPPGDQDPHYLRNLRRQVSAVADGREPALVERPAIEGGPAPALAKVLIGIGREVPGDDEEPAVEKVRRAGPLGVICPKCRAPIGRRCRVPGRNDQPGKERATAHPARAAVARGESLPDPAEQAREIDRRREVSRRMAARYEQEGEAS